MHAQQRYSALASGATDRGDGARENDGRGAGPAAMTVAGAGPREDDSRGGGAPRSL